MLQAFVVAPSAPESIKRLCLSVSDAAWRLSTERMTGIHHLFNLLTPALALFSFHCSVVYSLPPLSFTVQLSLGLAHLCSLLDWDSMYPEQVRTLGCSAFDSTMVYFPLTASSSWIPPQLSTCHKSRSTLAC